MSHWVVYMLRCSDKSLYTGVTIDIKRRLHEHNHDNKRGAAYTRGRRPVKLIYHEAHENRSAAGKREAAIKRMNRTEKLQLVKTGKIRKKGQK